MQIRFSTFPKTRTPPTFIRDVVEVFERHSDDFGTAQRDNGLISDQVLAVLREDLTELGFEVEASKREKDKIKRPVFFGENAQPDLQYYVDAWHPKWKAGLEVEAGRAVMGNAVYRDLIQALVMVEVDHLLLAVPQKYRYNASGTTKISEDYKKTTTVAEALYGHSRITIPDVARVVQFKGAWRGSSCLLTLS